MTARLHGPTTMFFRDGNPVTLGPVQYMILEDILQQKWPVEVEPYVKDLAKRLGKIPANVRNMVFRLDEREYIAMDDGFISAVNLEHKQIRAYGHDR